MCASFAVSSQSAKVTATECAKCLDLNLGLNPSDLWMQDMNRKYVLTDGHVTAESSEAAGRPRKNWRTPAACASRIPIALATPATLRASTVTTVGAWPLPQWVIP